MPVSGKLTQQVSQNTSTSGVSVVSTDPASIVDNQQWILKRSLIGNSTGLLLSITYADLTQYQLCTCTNGNIERTTFI